MANLSVTIAGVEWKAPITTASGIVNSGKEYGVYTDLNQLGALTTKGVSLNEWMGNAVPRITETYGGMLNSIGVQNLGVEGFIKADMPYLIKLDARVIVNVCGYTIDEYVAVVERLSQEEAVDMLEIKLSPVDPTTTHDWPDFSSDPKVATQLITAVRKATTKPLIAKLSPNNLSAIVDVAKATEAAGADALSMIGGMIGMRINPHNRRPGLGNKLGALTGPAIKPIGVASVYRVKQSGVAIPIIGMGGITRADDVIEYMLAGASAVGVGTANFSNPRVTLEIIEGLKDYMAMHQVSDINELVGAAL